MLKEQERVEKQQQNRKKLALWSEERKLIMALTRKRTEDTYGYAHYCNRHKTLVYNEHLYNCDCIRPEDCKVTKILAPTIEKESIYDLDTNDLIKLISQLIE